MGSMDQAAMTKSGVTDARGSLVTQIRFPKTWAGGLRIDEVAKEWAALFRRKQDGQVWYREPEISQNTFQTDDRYYEVLVTIPIVALVRPLPGQLEGFERMHFTQTNGFSALDVLYHSSTGWALANGGSTGTEGEAVVSAVDGDDFIAIHRGFLAVGTTYTAGGTLWLSTAGDGSLTTSEPTATPKTMVGKVIDGATLLINIDRRVST